MPVRFECPRCQNAFVRPKVDDDEAFVECPSCGAMAMSVGDATSADGHALARALSSTYDVPTSVQQNPSLSTDIESSASTPSAADPSDPFGSGSGVGAGVFSGLFTGSSAASHDARTLATTRETPDEVPEEAPAGRADAAGGRHTGPAVADLDLGLDDEFEGDFRVPTGPRAGSSAPRPTERRASSGTSLPPGLRDEPADERSAAIVGSALDDDAFGALEAAFNDMTERPAPRRGELTDEERAFLSGAPRRDPRFEGAPAPPPVRRPPPRPPSPGSSSPGSSSPGSSSPRSTSSVLRSAGPPPRRDRPTARRAAPVASDRPRAIALSPEARDAAFLPLKADGRADSRSDAASTAERSMGAAPAGRVAGEQADHDAALRAGAARKAARLRELGIVRPQRPAPRAAPTVFGGVSALALVGVVVVGVFVGSGVGAALAWRDERSLQAPLTSRARAEQQFVDGNRAYDTAVQLAARGDAASATAAKDRFGDAVGYYKAAINIDRTYALAHRAKGAALAKLQRWDEAALAYRDYLDLQSDAIDAADVREALARRGVGDGGAAAGGSGG